MPNDWTNISKPHGYRAFKLKDLASVEGRTTRLIKNLDTLNIPTHEDIILVQTPGGDAKTMTVGELVETIQESGKASNSTDALEILRNYFDKKKADHIPF